MKQHLFWLTCLSLLALLLPSTALALCSYPEYTQCGTPLSPITFTVVQAGPPYAYIEGDWYGYSANFTESVYVHDLTTNYIGPGSYTNTSNPSYGEPTQLTQPFADVHFGDQVEFVLHVYNDPNHPNGIDYCWGLSTCYKDYNGSTPIGHVFAENLPANECNQGVPCVFMGFEDLPHNENSDYDYNDFEFFVYGVQINGVSVATPEPSSLVLLTGAPLLFAIRRIRRLSALL